MQFMPLIFLFFFLNAPAGLVLYWLVNNVLSIAQQMVVNRSRQLETAKAQTASTG
jgi:YidC/Oxa1 family membrane protein insertase